jgi:hypothetical protein
MAVSLLGTLSIGARRRPQADHLRLPAVH